MRIIEARRVSARRIFSVLTHYRRQVRGFGDKLGDVAQLVDSVLEAFIVRCAGSTPVPGTTDSKLKSFSYLCFLLVSARFSDFPR